MTNDNPSFTSIDDLLDLIPEIPKDAILSRVLYKDEWVNVTLFAFDEGQELTEHTASKPAILQFLKGSAQLMLGEQKQQARPGSWIYMEPHLPHSIVAEEPMMMLLTLLK